MHPRQRNDRQAGNASEAKMGDIDVDVYAPSGQDYSVADGANADGGWSSRRADIMNRAAV